jgi:hypothetical protein
MFVLGLRPGTAATLSLWLAVFACLLGCARPAAAAQRAAVGQSVAGWLRVGMTLVTLVASMGMIRKGVRTRVVITRSRVARQRRR